MIRKLKLWCWEMRKKRNIGRKYSLKAIRDGIIERNRIIGDIECIVIWVKVLDGLGDELYSLDVNI